MSVDVEDYFQVQAFAGQVDRRDWAEMPCRVERNTDAVLQLFADLEVRATFFMLGWVAQRYPALARRIVDAGHELASHGYAHQRVMEQSPEQFREDIRSTKQILEAAGGAPVRGFRAASFSIGETTGWAYPILAEEGYVYSSSIYPIRHDLYGRPRAPRFDHRPRDGKGTLEIPVTTVTVFGQNLPCGGGGYFRLLPYRLSLWGLRRVNRRDGRPCMFYFHPWEIDPDQPRIPELSFRSRFRHYTNLARMEPKLRAVLKDLSWDRVDQVFLPRGAPSAAAAQ
jgi:polysaccharide deacetylase family protein (PEP-CTERM system associated)